MIQTAKVISEIANDTVQLKHSYKATPEQIYQAWVNPQALAQWFGPHSHSSKVEKFEAEEGGEYQIRMTPVTQDHDCKGDANGDSVCAGTFVKVIPNQQLVMTFNWIEGGEDMGETLLTIDIIETSTGSDVSLTHERIPTEELRQAHMGGWEGTLECLEEFMQS